MPDVRVRSTADAHKVLEAAGFHVDEVMVDPDARIRLGRVQDVYKRQGQGPGI